MARSIAARWTTRSRSKCSSLGPTIPLHCSDPFLMECASLAREYTIPLQTHLAESRTQAAIARTRYGASLVGHLESLGFLSEHLSVAHAIWLDDDEIAKLGH